MIQITLKNRKILNLLLVLLESDHVLTLLVQLVRDIVEAFSDLV